MAKVAADISMSLDGFVAGPGDGPELPLGKGGERLHEWVCGLARWRERQCLAGWRDGRRRRASGRSVHDNRGGRLGRRLFDNAGGWGDNPPFHLPVFVLSHEARDTLTSGGTSFTFVGEGIESALERATAATGGGTSRWQAARAWCSSA